MLLRDGKPLNLVYVQMQEIAVFFPPVNDPQITSSHFCLYIYLILLFPVETEVYFERTCYTSKKRKLTVEKHGVNVWEM